MPSPSTPSRSSIVKCFLGAVVAVALFEATRSMPETVGVSMWGFGLELLGEVDSVLLVVFGALASPSARTFLAQSQCEVEKLSRQLQAVVDSPVLEGVRMDLRAAPRGHGAWGLAQLRSSALGEG